MMVFPLYTFSAHRSATTWADFHGVSVLFAFWVASGGKAAAPGL